MALLQLGDGRFPAGGHVHSAGIESAVADGRVTGQHSLADYLRGRMVTVGLTDAALVAATVVRVGDAINTRHDIGLVSSLCEELDAEAEARIAPPPLRAVSRKLGRQLSRVAGRCWPSTLFAVARGVHPHGLHQSVALGVAAVAAELDPRAAATVAMHHALNTPAQAAVRLLGLDPFETVALTIALCDEATVIVDEAVTAASGPLCELPARSGPLCELAALDHPGWDMRLFAS
ncbi:MAG: urease accessory protein UreF [Actinobacteria bacterium]|nr:urease accessory protein UreF [Actinomycetota bacterium]